MTCPKHTSTKSLNFPPLLCARARSKRAFNALCRLRSSHGCGRRRRRSFGGPPGVRTARATRLLNEAHFFSNPDPFRP